MHQILFDQVETGWHNALPLGNGRMGAMLFFNKNTLHIALNHYDCYYQILSRYGKKKDSPRYPKIEQLETLTKAARERWDIPRSHYLSTLHPQDPEKRPRYQGTSHPMAGELLLKLSDKLDGAATKLRLLIEDACVEFLAEKDGKQLSVTAWIPKGGEGILFDMEQSEKGLLSSVELMHPSTRGLGGYAVSRAVHSDCTILRTAFSPEGEEGHSFVEEAAVYIPGSIAAVQDAPTSREDFRLLLEQQEKNFCFAASVRLGVENGVAECQRILAAKDTLRQQHQAFWSGYWVSRVRLPDAFLETLWYLHTYLAECASGRGGTHAEQCCGLNGLWDIRRPSMWGSMWYWDVNIQEAFWQSFSSNHLELAKDFCDGYLTFVADAEVFAQQVYGFSGIAIDHPHALYHCIHPWCAQFLWKYYAYSQDLDFLKEKAYPVFQKQLTFIKQLAKPDEKGILHIDPDISPEQGPVTRDSVITIACIKQLIRYTMQAAGILGRPVGEVEELETLLQKLPDYPLTADGSRYRDSALAPDDLPFRHPSILMPIFPAEEIDKHSPPSLRTKALNTLRYAAEHTELGVFGFGWIAAAAARMGEGNAALRILYEKGLDLCLHSNGMGYEESERWMNHCVVTKPPLYWPAMTEPSGGIVGAVNEMLLQSNNGVIEVFPALPDGHDGLTVPKNVYLHDDCFTAGDYGCWENCRFDGLLAQGGFVVSAQRIAGKTVWLRIHAQKGGTLRFWLPAEFSETGEVVLMEKETKPGEILLFGAEQDSPENLPAVQMRQAAESRRRIFLGENPDTAYYKAVDSFVCSFGFANITRPQWTQLVFDFGDTSLSKNYDDAYPKELCRMEGHLFACTAPIQIGCLPFDPDFGYGFSEIEGLSAKDFQKPDALRRDGIRGTVHTEFLLELPQGRYDLLVISGDGEENCATTVTLPQYGSFSGGTQLQSGRYQCLTIPVMHTEDALLHIAFDTQPDCHWTLNALFLNKQHGCL